MAERIADAVRGLLGDALPSGGTATVGLSGGVDSSLLLHVAAGCAPQGVAVAALHVNHGLSERADGWEELCRRMCAELDVPVEVRRVEVGSGPGLEERAREARLACLAESGADAVMMAHHAGDQAETLLLRALRGSGPRGLAAMRPRSVLPGTETALLRPLLGFARPEIESEARRLGIEWIEDPANLDLSHNRNWLRHEVLPEAGRRFPGAAEALARAAGNAVEAAGLLDCLASIDDGACRAGGEVNRDALAGLGEDRVRNWLAWSLSQRGLRSVTAGRLSECARQICGGGGFSADFGPCRLVARRGLLSWEGGGQGGAVDKMTRLCAL